MRDLGASELRWACPPEWLPADSTAGVEAARGIVGQERAVRALEFGLQVKSLGFNVFVTGLTGTGKMTAIETHLRPLAREAPPPDDLLYVYDFGRPERPRQLRLPAGRGTVLRDRMERMLRDLSASLPGTFESDEFQRRLDLAIEDLKTRNQGLVETFETRVRNAGFTMVQVQMGAMTRPEILPVVDEHPVTLDKLHALAADGKFDQGRLDELQAAHEKLSEEMQRVFHEVMSVRDEMVQRAEELRRDTVDPMVSRALADVAEAVGDPRVKPFLAEVKRDMMANLDLLSAPDTAGEEGEGLLRYRVNLIVDNGATRGAPVVIETEPTFPNLFGTIDARVGQTWRSTTDHTRIRAGSLLRANGGFLVVNAFDAILEPGVWPALKRALRYRRVVIRPGEVLFALSGQTLSPEPVDLDVKVVMVGDRSLYDLLHSSDEEFRKIFKVLADFDSEMPNGSVQVGEFLSVMAKIVAEEGLPHLDRSGMAALVEEGVRLAHDRRRISTRFSDAADVMREAAFLARRAGLTVVGREEILDAVRSRRDRSSLPEEKLTELIMEGLLEIRTEGSAVGQINGLAVYDLGYHAFGLPGRITASVALGRDGVVNVEREARLSGSTHDKGVLIIAGYLRGMFARETPLSMTASVAFEQSYGGVDGDSASSTEVYAILSALAGLPIRQDLAVTGSVDQHGTVQAIGGVNEKVEGFFELCRRRELTGSQGVLIPMANAGDLQLSPAVVEAVAAGLFHVIGVATIEEGISILTGVPAGRRDAGSGAYPADTVFGRCAAALAGMAEQLRRFREV